MKEIQDTVQVGLANGTAIGISLSQVNEILTFISLGLAIGFSIYKFVKYEKIWSLLIENGANVSQHELNMIKNAEEELEEDYHLELLKV